VLKYLADVDLPSSAERSSSFRRHVQRDPIGRNCSREERNDYYETFDLAPQDSNIWSTAMQRRFADLNLTFFHWGQISFDISPPAGIKRTASSFYRGGF
jgi:hypothetical protein